jgi:hypothetical protein
VAAENTGIIEEAQKVLDGTMMHMMLHTSYYLPKEAHFKSNFNLKVSCQLSRRTRADAPLEVPVGRRLLTHDPWKPKRTQAQAGTGSAGS